MRTSQRLPDAPPPVVHADERTLAAWLRQVGPVLVGFSGGVDSSYLASVAVDVLGPEGVLAVIGRSASYPLEQWRTARAVADRCGIPVLEVDTHELDDPRYAANPNDRCFFCKSELWGRLAPLAATRGMTVVDGTIADDLADWRPGAAAARQHRVRSPLAELGFTKADVRRLSAARALPTAELPSAPCLASRLPYGTPVTVARLRQVEAAEAALRDGGATSDLRVRHHGDLARVELDPALLDGWWNADALRRLRDAVVGTGGYRRVAVDLRGFRSGSLNQLAGLRRAPAARDSATTEELHAATDCVLDRILTVEALGALALLHPAAPLATVLAAGRQRLLAHGESIGHTHVALEILDQPGAPPVAASHA